MSDTARLFAAAASEKLSEAPAAAAAAVVSEAAAAAALATPERDRQKLLELERDQQSKAQWREEASKAVQAG